MDLQYFTEKIKKNNFADLYFRWNI